MASDQPVFYKDIARLPPQLREQWKKTCQEELEALRKHKVFELANLPKGCKAIKNHWVFMTKSDGCKKARLLSDRSFMGIWECHDLGKLKEFLGISIRHSGCKIILDQKVYLTKVLDCFNMTNAIIANTPLPHRYTPVAHTGNPDPTLRTQYQAIIGSLLYLMLGTRPDIAFAVIKLSQFSANPSKEHFEWAKYICRYLAGTKDYTMVFDGKTNEGLIVHSDSDWATDVNNRHSVTGYFFKLARSLVSWLSRAQKHCLIIYQG